MIGLDGESEGAGGTVMRLCAQDKVSQKESEQNEVDGTKKVADSMQV